MVNSQREMQKSAQDIARANIRPNSNEDATLNAANTNRSTTLPPVTEPGETSQRGLDESLVELRRQQQLFTANATVVKVADQTLGSIIDVQS